MYVSDLDSESRAGWLRRGSCGACPCFTGSVQVPSAKRSRSQLPSRSHLSHFKGYHAKLQRSLRTSGLERRTDVSSEKHKWRRGAMQVHVAKASIWESRQKGSWLVYTEYVIFAAGTTPSFRQFDIRVGSNWWWWMWMWMWMWTWRRTAGRGGLAHVRLSLFNLSTSSRGTILYQYLQLVL